jgi:hypothetical protein
LLDKHVCKSGELSNPRLPQRLGSSPPPKRTVHLASRCRRLSAETKERHDPVKAVLDPGSPAES